MVPMRKTFKGHQSTKTTKLCCFISEMAAFFVTNDRAPLEETLRACHSVNTLAHTALTCEWWFSISSILAATPKKARERRFRES